MSTAVVLLMEDADTVGEVIGPFASEEAAEQFTHNNSVIRDHGSFFYVVRLKAPEEFK